MKKLLLSIAALFIASTSFAALRTFTVTVPDSVQCCFLAGSMNGWDTSATPMTEVAASNPKQFTAQIEMSDEELTKLEYKALAGPDWAYQQTAADNNKTLTVTINGFNAVYKTPLKWGDAKITVLVPSTVSVCYIMGSFNRWNPSDTQMKLNAELSDKENSAFDVTITNVLLNVLEFKFLAGPGFPFEQKSGNNYKYSEYKDFVACPEFKALFDPSKAGDIFLNITVPAGSPAVFVIGSYNSWSLEKDVIEAVKQADGTYKAKFEFAQIVEFKIFWAKDWGAQETIEGNRKVEFQLGASNIHNITVPTWNNPPASVSDLNININVYGADEHIYVTGAENAQITIADMMGRIIERGNTNGDFISQPLNAGIYLVNINNKTIKVAVK